MNNSTAESGSMTSMTINCLRKPRLWPWPPTPTFLVYYYLSNATLIISLVGVVGNILNLVVLSSRGMRNKTNVFLSAMAFADLCFLLTTIWLHLGYYNTLLDNDAMYRALNYSKTAVMLLGNWFCSCSTWFAVAVTIERLIAVRWPLRVGSLLGKKCIIITVISIAVSMFLSNLFNIFRMYPIEKPMCNDSSRFVIDYLHPNNSIVFQYVRVSLALSGISNVVLPICLLASFNLAMVVALYNNRRAITNLGQSSGRGSRNSQECKVALTVFVITVAAVVFCTPSVALALWDASELNRVPNKPKWYISFAFVCNLLVIIDRALNFLLYCVSSLSFRRKLCAVFRGAAGERSKRIFSNASTYTEMSLRRRSLSNQMLQKAVINSLTSASRDGSASAAAGKEGEHMELLGSA